MNIFEETTRPDQEYFFQSYDQNDPRLGSIVQTDIGSYDDCRFVLVGSPQDLGVERNRGRIGAAEAPDAIRSVLYKMAHPKELEDAGFFDLGNIHTNGRLEEIHSRQLAVIKKLLKDSKIPIVLGGGNDISYPDCRAVSEVFSDIAAINIDNHFDVRYNTDRNSGTPYRMLLEEGHISTDRFIEMGCQKPANSHIYRDYLEEKGVRIVYFDELRDRGLSSVFEEITSNFDGHPVFWGYDMDSVRASDAPGVSAITPVGISAEEAVEIASFAGEFPSTKLFEISEVNPTFDIDNRTTRLAALMIIHFVSSHLFARR